MLKHHPRLVRVRQPVSNSTVSSPPDTPHHLVISAIIYPLATFLSHHTSSQRPIAESEHTATKAHGTHPENRRRAYPRHSAPLADYLHCSGVDTASPGGPYRQMIEIGAWDNAGNINLHSMIAAPLCSFVVCSNKRSVRVIDA